MTYLQSKHNYTEAKHIIYKNGKVITRRWISYSCYHNPHGPAVISYNNDGTVRNYQYYINGMHLTETQWIIKSSLDDYIKIEYKLKYG